VIEKIVGSGIVVILVVLTRVLVGRALRRDTKATIEARRGHIVLLRNVSLLVGIVLIAMIWADELRVVGLSLVAFAVAIAISLQDVVKSAVGAAVRATSGSYTIGDRIAVGEVRGQVIDHSLLTTTLIEIGPGSTRTGRTITMPNSLPLTLPVLNETAGHDYVLHSFAVTSDRGSWRADEAALLGAAEECAGEYVEPARRQMEQRARRHALTPANVDPLVFLSASEGDAVTLTVRIPVHASAAGTVEDAIMRQWLDDSVSEHPTS
jgi:small-conductance mechanosensitive channel